MPAGAVLLVETDTRILVSLPQALPKSLPHIHVHICTSADSLIHQLRLTSCDTVAIRPLLMDAHRCAKQKKPQQLLAPLLVTASRDQHHVGQTALERDAFDRTLDALQSSMHLLLNMDDEQSLFDVAASMETLTKQRAMERLLILCKHGSTQ